LKIFSPAANTGPHFPGPGCGPILVVAAGLAIDAFVHLDPASSYDGVKSSVLTQGDLFRVEAALARRVDGPTLLGMRPC
jgi:hypothetical protein